MKTMGRHKLVPFASFLVVLAGVPFLPGPRDGPGQGAAKFRELAWGSARALALEGDAPVVQKKASFEEVTALLEAAEEAEKASEGKEGKDAFPDLKKAALSLTQALDGLQELRRQPDQKVIQKADLAFRSALERQIKVIRRIGTCPTKEAVDFLRSFYTGDRGIVTCGAVTDALAAIGTVEAAQVIVLVGLPIVMQMSLLEEPTELALARFKDRKAVAFLAKSLMGPVRQEKRALRMLIRALGRLEGRDRDRALKRELKGPDPEIVAEVLTTIWRNHVPDMGTDAARLVRSSNEAVQRSALLVLEGYGPEKYRSSIARAFKSTHWKSRGLAVDILGKVKAAMKSVYPMLHDPHPRVRLAAVSAVLEDASADAVAALIERLKKEDNPRVKDDISTALVRLTGRDIGLAGFEWEAFWNAHKGEVDVRLRTPEELSKIKAKSDLRVTSTYHGIPVLSDRVSFIIDTSASMEKPYVTKGAKKDAEPKPKIEVAKAELEKCLTGVPMKVRFNVFVFSRETLSFRPQLVEKTLKLMPELLGWIKSRTVTGGTTDIYKALVRAMEDPDVDTIFLLSDGMPTTGKIRDPAQILERVRAENRILRIRINTIGFDLQPPAESLMMSLAAQNYGIFAAR